MIQDWRHYREALTADQVKGLAFDSVDGAGNKLRSCEMPDEGGDTDWKDINGHDCKWYQEKKKTVPDICSTPEINQNCPVACKYASPCWMGKDAVVPSKYTIWNRVMYLSEESKGSGLVCVRDGVDAVAECCKFQENPSLFPSIPGRQDWLKWSKNANYRPGDIALDDCDELQRRIRYTFHFDSKLGSNLTFENSHPLCSLLNISPKVTFKLTFENFEQSLLLFSCTLDSNHQH